ncbi:hypothetical protein BH24BAC1_BH24BAC1_05180 [soil metagenome]
MTILAGGVEMGCTSTKTPQQKKTQKFKRSQRLGTTPCPCNS